MSKLLVVFSVLAFLGYATYLCVDYSRETHAGTEYHSVKTTNKKEDCTYICGRVRDNEGQLQYCCLAIEDDQILIYCEEHPDNPPKMKM